MPSVVLVTGVSRYLGSRLAAQLSADPSIVRVIGVDTTPPSKADLAMLGRTEFMRADIRNPLIAKVIAQAGVETVVHASVTATPHLAGGRTSMKEMNVIGTMQLLAACQKSETVRRLVVKSTTSVYGSSAHDPAVFTEDLPARRLPSAGYSKDAVEVEGYVRGFGRRRPDIAVTVLRFANFIGPVIETPLTRYLAMPVVPTALGFDPRLQLLHEDDAIEVLRLAATSDRPGVFNVAGEGTLVLSQAIRRAGRIGLPVPSPAVEFVSRLVRSSGRVDFSPEQLQFLVYGRQVDITRLKKTFGYTPRHTTAQAFDDFLTGRPVPAIVSREKVRQAELTIDKFVHAGMGVIGRA
ncbi:UDP-glucose 4-epimerase [Jatrophihabitans sp. GAS493]|uniref:NAD-dependent epimerase/dehydratase family protein n=1 Tax=Jatrophihabitans sp. GAS493 TaxID=1907575 RepID=UPI000BB84671|nr:NAD-dependent epimerase/dehydratase family protein [Jatrophihabitans sp. GAS493]SOD70664.1 UDP-glucose 4-epimerase [Jatrophihabitans sp. GAS493]